MRVIFSLFLLLISSFPAFATVRTVSDTDGGATYSSVTALATAINAGSISGGDTVQFNNCDTFDGLSGYEILKIQNWSPAVTFTSYGACPERKPIFDSLGTISSSWTVSAESTLVYYTLNSNFTGDYKDPTIIYEDGFRLHPVRWQGSLSATLSLLTPGTFTSDYSSWDAGRFIYVATTDGLSPETHTMTYPKAGRMFSGNNGSQEGDGGIVIDGLEFNNFSDKAFACGDIYQEWACRDTIVRNSTFRNIGVSSVFASGANTSILNNDVHDGGGSATFPGDTGVFVCVKCSGGEIAYNTSDITRFGTGLELAYYSTGMNIHHNNFTKGYGHCIENWVGTINNNFYKNYCDQSEAPYPMSGGFLLSITGDTTNDVFSNNVLIGNAMTSGAIRLKGPNGGEGNKVYNNTFVNMSANGFLGSTMSIYSDGTFALPKNQYIENNIFISGDTTTEKYITNRGCTDCVINNNIYWSVNSTGFTATLGYTDYATFEAWKTASGLDATSKNEDPLLNTDYSLKSNSPARDAGITLAEVLDDYLGITRPKGSAYDIGAFEFSLAPGIYIR